MLLLRVMSVSKLICHLYYATVADVKGLGGGQGVFGQLAECGWQLAQSGRGKVCITMQLRLFGELHCCANKQDYE